MILGQDGHIWAIDNGLSFHAEFKLRTVIWDFAREPVPTPLLRDIRRVSEQLRSGPVRADLLSLLSRREVDATARRAEALVRTATFPEPGGDRPYPWPPV